MLSLVKHLWCNTCRPLCPYQLTCPSIDGSRRNPQSTWHWNCAALTVWLSIHAVYTLCLGPVKRDNNDCVFFCHHNWITSGVVHIAICHSNSVCYVADEWVPYPFLTTTTKQNAVVVTQCERTFSCDKKAVLLYNCKMWCGITLLEPNSLGTGAGDPYCTVRLLQGVKEGGSYTEPHLGPPCPSSPPPVNRFTPVKTLPSVSSGMRSLKIQNKRERITHYMWTRHECDRRENIILAKKIDLKGCVT